MPVDPNAPIATSSAAFSQADERWMRHALILAKRGETEDDEVPVGAVLVDAEGELLAEGWNRNITDQDPTAHAEIVAMRQGGMRIGNHRLLGATLYVTLEPCLMCVGAAMHARVATIVYGAIEPKAGAMESTQRAHEHPALNHRVTVVSGVLAAESRDLLQAFFASRRG